MLIQYTYKFKYSSLPPCSLLKNFTDSYHLNIERGIYLLFVNMYNAVLKRSTK